jgi:hypothetical protein
MEGTVVVDSQGRDFFISYTQVNRAWAEWIAVQLEQVGYSTVLQAWDFRPGSDFIHEMQQATSTAGRTIAVLSPAFFASEFGRPSGGRRSPKIRRGRRGCWCRCGCSRVIRPLPLVEGGSARQRGDSRSLLKLADPDWLVVQAVVR